MHEVQLETQNLIIRKAVFGDFERGELRLPEPQKRGIDTEDVTHLTHRVVNFTFGMNNLFHKKCVYLAQVTNFLP